MRENGEPEGSPRFIKKLLMKTSKRTTQKEPRVVPKQQNTNIHAGATTITHMPYRTQLHQTSKGDQKRKNHGPAVTPIMCNLSQSHVPPLVLPSERSSKVSLNENWSNIFVTVSLVLLEMRQLKQKKNLSKDAKLGWEI